MQEWEAIFLSFIAQDTFWRHDARREKAPEWIGKVPLISVPMSLGLPHSTGRLAQTVAVLLGSREDGVPPLALAALDQMEADLPQLQPADAGHQQAETVRTQVRLMRATLKA